MASLEVRGETYRLVFRYGGRKHHKNFTAEDRDEADQLVARAERRLGLLNKGDISLPAGADLGTFLVSDGKLAQAPKADAPLPIGKLYEQYSGSLPDGAIEANSLYTIKIHLGHFKRILRARTPLQTVTLDMLQNYVSKRLGETGRRGKVTTTTIRKEVTSLSGVWTWAVRSGRIHGAFPNRGLRYPKTAEKPHFQTWAEIEKQIEHGAGEELWESLFLSLDEVDDLLKFVKENSNYPFLYPMVATAAHTGARRSELIRAKVQDVDLTGKTMLIREKKRVKGQHSTRRVPLSPFLLKTLKAWLKDHPSGDLFYLGRTFRSRKSRPDTAPITPDEAHDHFQRVLKETEWDKVRGWHIFRHSFCSNCAAQGIDQRTINSWVGHQTEEMAKRYRHLFPDRDQKAITSVFQGK